VRRTFGTSERGVTEGNEEWGDFRKFGAQRQNRTADTRLFRALLYRLSYLGPTNNEDHLVPKLDEKGNEELRLIPRLFLPGASH
jgi:hypothetical protein